MKHVHRYSDYIKNNLKLESISTNQKNNSLFEASKLNFKEGDLVLIHYWYDHHIEIVKIIEKVSASKFKISYDIEECKIKNAPDEIIKKSEIIDYFKGN